MAKPAALTLPLTTGTRRALVLFALFKGDPTSPVPSWAVDIFNPDLPGSFSHFYDTMSFGRLQVRGEVAPRVYESSRPAAAYLSTDPSERGQFGQFVQGILRQANQDIDFAEFDSDCPDGVPNAGDDDGVVDVVFIVLERIPAGFLLSEATGIGDLGFNGGHSSKDLGRNGQAIKILAGQGSIQQGRYFAEAVGAMSTSTGMCWGCRISTTPSSSPRRGPALRRTPPGWEPGV